MLVDYGLLRDAQLSRSSKIITTSWVKLQELTSCFVCEVNIQTESKVNFVKHSQSRLNGMQMYSISCGHSADMIMEVVSS